MALSNGIIPSVGHTGICFDNAMAESFNATIKKELIHLHTWPTLSKVMEVFRYIEVYYNRKRPGQQSAVDLLKDRQPDAGYLAALAVLRPPRESPMMTGIWPSRTGTATTSLEDEGSS